MIFAQPMWLILLALAPLIIWLHSRRTRAVPVSSILLWSRLAGGNTTRPARTKPWRNWPLILQLLILVLITLALAAPTFGSARLEHLIVVLDSSGSMRATDVAPTRFRAATTEVNEAVSGLPPGALVTILVADEDPKAVAVRTTHRTAALAALRDSRPGFEGAGFAAAAEMARAVTKAEEATRILLVGDPEGVSRASPLLAGAMTGRDGAIVKDVIVGGPTSNYGFASLGAAPIDLENGIWRVTGDIAGAAPSSVIRLPVAVRFRPSGARSSLEWDSLDVSVDDNGSGRFEFDLDVPGAGLLELRLPAGDKLVQDDVARIFLLDDIRTVRVLVLGPANEPLDKALQSIPGVELFGADALPENSSEFDLVIADGVSIEDRIGTSTWWINTPMSQGIGGGMAVPTDWSRRHPLSRNLDWSALEVDEIYPRPDVGNAITLVGSGGKPLLSVRAGDEGYELYSHFAINRSNWAQLASFPSFVANLVRWIEPSVGSAVVSPCLPGTPCPLPASYSSTSVQLVEGASSEVDGDGAMESYAVLDGSSPLSTADGYVFVPRYPGLYEVGDEARSQPLAINAFFPGESRMAGADAQGGAPSFGPVRGDLGLWRWLLTSALILFLSEGLTALRRGGRSGRRGLSLGVQAFAVALLFLAILDIQVSIPFRESRAVVVIDEEVTVASEARRTLETFLDDLSSDRSAAQLLGKISFTPPSEVMADIGEWRSDEAGDRRRGDEVAPPRTLASDGKDLWTALELAAGMLTGSEDGQIVLATVDAGRDAIDPRLVERMRSHAVPVNVFPIDSLPTGEVLITSLEAPSRIYEDDRFELRATVLSQASADSTIRVLRQGELRVEQTVALQEGRNRIDLMVSEPETGDVLYEVKVVTADDPFDQNNTGGVVATVRNKPKVAIFTPQAGWGEILASSLRSQGLEVDILTPIDAPWNLEGWLEYSAAILMNVPALDLHSTQMEHLETWVRVHGGGLLFLGGENSFGPGGYYQTNLDRLSPLSSKVPSEAPEVALLFVLDRSGSMQQVVGDVNRLEIAKQATLAALELLGEESRAGIVVFDSEAQTLTPVQPVTSLEVFQSDLATFGTGGGTSVHPALVEAYEQMSQVESATRHIVLMTDGLSQPGDFDEILDRMRSEGISLSTVAIGRGADVNLLSDLARTGDGAFHATGDFQALPSILAQEALLLSSSPVEERTFRPRPVDSEASFFDEYSREIPSLDGYVKTTAKPEAQVHLMGPEDDPLLASWRFGLGRVVAFASHGAGEWSESWLQWFEFPRIWAQAVRWVLPETSRQGLSLTTTTSNGMAFLSVEVSSDGRLVDGLDVEVDIVPPGDSQNSSVVRLDNEEQGVYRGTFVLETVGIYSATARVAGAEPGGGFEPSEALIYHPYASRYQFSEREAGNLERVVALTGGRMLEEPSDVFGSPPQWRFRASSTWPFLALVALITFIVALMIRYLRPGSLPWSGGGARRNA